MKPQTPIFQGIATALVTPTTPQGVDYDRFGTLIDWQIAQGINGLVICGTHDGYFKEDGPVVQQIRDARADVVFVCLGFPRQEKWIAAHGGETGARLLIGLGGSLDVFAGRVKRAPAWFQNHGLEWFYRLASQPSRAGRILKIAPFLLKALGARLRGG